MKLYILVPYTTVPRNPRQIKECPPPPPSGIQLSKLGVHLQNLGDRLGQKKYFKALVQLGHLRVKDVFVGNISKNCTKIGYINQHHDNLFSLFILFIFFLVFRCFSLLLEKLQSKTIFIG